MSLTWVVTSEVQDSSAADVFAFHFLNAPKAVHLIDLRIVFLRIVAVFDSRPFRLERAAAIRQCLKHLIASM